MLTKALIINAIVLFAVLESDLGPARKVTNFRLVRPLLTTAAVAPLFLEALATHGTGLALEIGGTVAGILFGLGAARLMSVRRDAASGQVVTGAGAVYAALWIAIVAARSLFSIGAGHWFNHSLTTWLVSNHIPGAAITDTMVLMAIGMALARTAGIAVRTSQVRRQPAVAGIGVSGS